LFTYCNFVIKSNICIFTQAVEKLHLTMLFSISFYTQPKLTEKWRKLLQEKAWWSHCGYVQNIQLPPYPAQTIWFFEDLYS